MSEEKVSDILVTITDGELPKLAELYKGIIDWCPYVYSFIKTGIDWKNKSNTTLTTFMSPNNCWQEDGTFIALMQFGNYDIFVFTLNETCQNLYNGLTLTKRINWKQPTVFFNVHSRHYSTVRDVIESLHLDVHFDLSYDVFTIKADLALNFNVSCPSDVYIKRLDGTAATIIDSLYQAHRYRYGDGDKFIAVLLEMNECFGIFSKDNDKLLAWVMQTCLGQIGFLQTTDGHQRKGYATLLTQTISKAIARLGHNPMSSVASTNEPSQNMFTKLGFLKIHDCYFLEVHQN